MENGRNRPIRIQERFVPRSYQTAPGRSQAHQSTPSDQPKQNSKPTNHPDRHKPTQLAAASQLMHAAGYGEQAHSRSLAGNFSVSCRDFAGSLRQTLSTCGPSSRSGIGALAEMKVQIRQTRLPNWLPRPLPKIRRFQVKNYLKYPLWKFVSRVWRIAKSCRVGSFFYRVLAPLCDYRRVRFAS